MTAEKSYYLISAKKSRRVIYDSGSEITYTLSERGRCIGMLSVFRCDFHLVSDD